VHLCFKVFFFSYCRCNRSVDKILHQFISSSWSIHTMNSNFFYFLCVSYRSIGSETKEVTGSWSIFYQMNWSTWGKELMQYFINSKHDLLHVQLVSFLWKQTWYPSNFRCCEMQSSSNYQINCIWVFKIEVFWWKTTFLAHFRRK
jgi:hypothetical protein